jgi:F-type H+-transporting ATPase subunit a
MAMDYFAQCEVDYAVIEVGMGGRLDSTNIITPILSVITNIALDHTQFLGDTLAQVAGEKAGIIKPSVGKDYERYAPYLLTAFFFIFLSNLMGLVPFFPGGANVTGNIAITLVLAICTFLTVNLFGSREYWREVLWPDVPLWMKCPVPLMPVIEIFGLFTKPFALTVRLLANIMAGHSVILALVCIIFITHSMGALIGGSMTVVSVLFTIFMNVLELLVAFIQAYVFTMLSAVFIGLSRVEHNKE